MKIKENIKENKFIIVVSTINVRITNRVESRQEDKSECIGSIGGQVVDSGEEEDQSIDDINFRPFKGEPLLQSQVNPKVHPISINGDLSEPNVAGNKAAISNRAHLLH